jgi:peroxisomal membrane protein 4
MIFLFRSGTLQEKIRLIFKATRQHASNLARFALLYKGGMMLLRRTNGGKEASVHSFLSGLHGGYWVFGHGKAAYSSVNQQIVTYIFARVVLALAKLVVQPPGDNALVGSRYGGHGGVGLLGLSEEHVAMVKKYSWPVFASLSWASVMWLFEGYPDTLQGGLRSSMTYMYVAMISFVLLLITAEGEEDSTVPSTPFASPPLLPPSDTFRSHRADDTSPFCRYADSENWDSPRNLLWHNK